MVCRAMNDTDRKRLLGLRALLQDAVEHGASAVERVHRATADRTFAVLEAVEPVREPAKVVHAVHDVVVAGVYDGVRGVNRVVGGVLAAVIAETTRER